MEILLINETVYTKELVKAALKKHYRYRRRSTRICAFAFGVLCLIFSALLFSISNVAVGVFYIIIALVFFLLVFKGELLYFNRFYKSTMATATEGKSYYEFSESEIAGSRQLQYHSITRVIELKNGFVLIFQDTPIILAKDGFIKGDEKTFKTFIAKKCADAKKDFL